MTIILTLLIITEDTTNRNVVKNRTKVNTRRYESSVHVRTATKYKYFGQK
jgi:hypothetical protein